jgi:hypothetical protein
MAATPARSRYLPWALLGALAVAACAGSGQQQVENTDFSAQFTIDDDWALYDEQEYVSAVEPDLGPGERDRRLATTWIRAFDASDRPSLANVLRDDSAAPHGVARIDLLDEAERESANLTSLRAAHLGFDPVRAQRKDPDEGIDVLRHEELSLEGGQHGIRMVVAYDTPDGARAVVDQTTLLDGANSVRYLFVVGCSDRCYADNRDTIEEVAGSWTISMR